MMKRWLLFCSLFFAWTLQAGIEVRQFPEPQLEARYQNLIAELRCLVCQNQSLADSNADLAEDLRDEVYAMLLAGKTDAEIVDYLVARYGDFVRYRPPMKPVTALLWFGPFLGLVTGGFILWQVARRRRPQPPPPLSVEEHRRLAALLEDEDHDS